MNAPSVLVVCLSCLVVFGCTPSTDSYQGPPPKDRTVAETLPTLDASGGTLVWQSSSEVSLESSRKIAVTVQLPQEGARVSYLLTNTSEVDAYNPSLQKMLSVVEPPRSLAVSPLRNVSSSLHRPHRRGPQEGLPAGWAQGKDPRGRQVVAEPVPLTPAVGDALDFREQADDESLVLVPTHLRYRSPSPVANRTLNLWVADDCWPEGGVATDPSKLVVTQAMVEALAERFLKDGTNDIYGWVTGIYGPEWADAGVLPGDNLIDGRGDVHVFILNLNPGRTSTGGLMGYFWALNNFDPSAAIDDSILEFSNGKVLFTLDARALADPDNDGDPDTSDSDEWAITDYWPAEAVSTLAHEFQHMIHFYQKQVRHQIDAETETWIDEMASLVTEDLVADKLGVPGPRAVLGYGAGAAKNEAGWLPLFNATHDRTSLTAWEYEDPYANYASAYAFGAWLLRNYGGPSLFRSLVQNDRVDTQAVVEAVNATNLGQAAFVAQTFRTLVRDWGLACYLASGTQAPHRYASDSEGGRLSWTVDERPYSVGSIDLVSYRFTQGAWTLDGPFIFDPAKFGPLGSLDTVAAGATFFYDAGVKTGTFQTSLVLPAMVQLTVVVTPTGGTSP